MDDNTLKLWEEKDLIETPTKLENKLTFVQNDGINETKNESAKNECADIGNKKTWKRECPKCNTILLYSKKKYMDDCNKIQSSCKSCAFKGHPKSESHKHKLHLSLTGRKLTSTHRLNISKSICGKNHPNYGKKASVSTKFKMSVSRKKRIISKRTKLKVRQSLLNLSPEIKKRIIRDNKKRIVSDYTRLKMRLARIKYLEKVKLHGAQLRPSFNFKACLFFDSLNKQNGWNLQHAMNGGEFYVKDLGYWVDAYDKDKNIVVEYDERQHNKKKEQDLRRMNEIKQHLHCKFYRCDSINEELVEC